MADIDDVTNDIDYSDNLLWEWREAARARMKEAVEVTEPKPMIVFPDEPDCDDIIDIKQQSKGATRPQKPFNEDLKKLSEEESKEDDGLDVIAERIASRKKETV